MYSVMSPSDLNEAARVGPPTSQARRRPRAAISAATSAGVRDCS